jgi:HD-like signal output (HDOD) protein
VSAKVDSEELDRLLESAETLPACPPVLAKIADVCADPTSSARDLGNVIATDEALTSRLIKLVNSAYYGLRGTISTVTQAVVILGYQEIRNMIYAVRAEEVFLAGRVADGIDLLAVWDHSLRVAVLARELCYRVRYPVPEEVFVAGIIHDVGQVILNQLLGSDYRAFVSRIHGGSRDLAEAEAEEYGIDHAEVGRRLALRWDFPESLQAAVAGHHRLPESKSGPEGIAPFVLTANSVTVTRGRGGDFRSALAALPPAVTEFLRMDLESLEESAAAAAEEYSRIRGIFDVTGAGREQ